jgi:hypothetical protein
VNTTTSISRYLNNLRVLFPCDVGVMELAARTLVKLGQLPGSKGVESFEYDIKQAFEFISEERNEVRLTNQSLALSILFIHFVIKLFHFRENVMRP